MNCQEWNIILLPEGGLRLGGDSVQRVEAETEKTVHIRLGSEGRRDSLGRLNSLASNTHAANLDDISVDNTAGGGTITVGDVPGVTRQLLGGRGVAGGVDVLAVNVTRGGQAGKDPEVGGAGVEVQVEDLSRGPDGHRGDVGVVVSVGWAGGGASLVTTQEPLVVHARGVGDGRGQPFGDGGIVLQVRLVDGQGPILLVVVALDLLDAGPAFLEVIKLVGGRDGRGNCSTGEGGYEESVGGDHLVGLLLGSIERTDG